MYTLLNDTNKLRINKHSLCWSLLGMGFDLGSNHDVDKIKSNIPEEYKEDFLQGTSIA